VTGTSPRGGPAGGAGLPPCSPGGEGVEAGAKERVRCGMEGPEPEAGAERREGKGVSGGALRLNRDRGTPGIGARM